MSTDVDDSSEKEIRQMSQIYVNRQFTLKLLDDTTLARCESQVFTSFTLVRVKLGVV